MTRHYENLFSARRHFWVVSKSFERVGENNNKKDNKVQLYFERKTSIQIAIAPASGCGKLLPVFSLYLITWNFRDMLISRFWGSHISRHLNFAILRKFCIFTHFIFAFLSEALYFFVNVVCHVPEFDRWSKLKGLSNQWNSTTRSQ